ncbi:MAG: hypothetical protein WBG11_06550 [Methylocella sp.]
MAPVISELIPITATAVAGIAGVIGLVEIILDLRAKARARDVLSRKAVDDPELKELVNQMTISSGRVALETASKAISNALAGELRESDLRRVEEGLHQAKKSDERRYINMLLF